MREVETFAEMAEYRVRGKRERDIIISISVSFKLDALSLGEVEGVLWISPPVGVFFVYSSGGGNCYQFSRRTAKNCCSFFVFFLLRRVKFAYFFYK